MSGTRKKRKCTFRGQYKSLQPIRDFVVAAARDAGLNQEEVYAVELAVDEACCNIIDHAYEGEDKGDIECCAVVTEGEVEVVLRDQGKTFDPEKVKKPAIKKKLKDVKPRGAGFFLMRKMMDELEYSSSPQEGNQMRLVKRKSGAAP